MKSGKDMTTSNTRYDAVTLDMGLTLVDLESNTRQELIALAAKAGLSLTLDDVRRATREFWHEWTAAAATRVWQPSPAQDRATSYEIDRQIFLRMGITDGTLHAEANRRSREIFDDATTYRIFPEVFDALAALRSRVGVLGILSNWGWWLPELCAELGLADYFDFIITSARVGAAKPHPNIFRAALAEAGSSPARALHVGDDLAADVRGAQALGITGVLLDRTGAAAPDGFPVVRSLTEVVALL